MFQLLTNPPSSDWRVPERSILRRKVAKRLKLAGCEIIDLDSNIDWQTAGDFELIDHRNPK
jgi:hypothetical protein